MANALLVALPPARPWRLEDASRPDGVLLRPIVLGDLDAVGEVYRRTYLDSSEEMSPQEAADDVRAAWDGEHGTWLEAASFGAWQGEDLVGAVLTVKDAPWPDVPRGPFVIDLFVDAAHRRRGIGRALVESVLAATGGGVALRVDDGAQEARALYASLGFRELPPG